MNIKTSNNTDKANDKSDVSLESRMIGTAFILLALLLSVLFFYSCKLHVDRYCEYNERHTRNQREHRAQEQSISTNNIAIDVVQTYENQST